MVTCWRWSQPITLITEFFGAGRFTTGVTTTHFWAVCERADVHESSDGDVRVWLVERTYSDDEQNLIILTYATPDGEQYFRKERALTSFGDVRDTTAALDADLDNLGLVDDPDLQEQYAAEARRMAEVHVPDDVI